MGKKSFSPTEISKVVPKVETPKSVAEPKKPEPKQAKPDEKISSKIDCEWEVGRTLHIDYDEIIPPFVEDYNDPENGTKVNQYKTKREALGGIAHKIDDREWRCGNPLKMKKCNKNFSNKYI